MLEHFIHFIESYALAIASCWVEHRYSFFAQLQKIELPPTAIDDADDTPELREDRKLQVWAIHSENSGSEENVIFIREINVAIKDIDAFLFTPSLGTGVDISTEHFDAVFGVFHAVSQSATECAQQLWRNRPNVPMYIWVALRPPFGCAETNARRIKNLSHYSKKPYFYS